MPVLVILLAVLLAPVLLLVTCLVDPDREPALGATDEAPAVTVTGAVVTSALGEPIVGV